MEGTDDKPRAEVAGELCRGAKEEKELKNERCDAAAEHSEVNPSPTKSCEFFLRKGCKSTPQHKSKTHEPKALGRNRFGERGIAYLFSGKGVFFE